MKGDKQSSSGRNTLQQEENAVIKNEQNHRMHRVSTRQTA
uniref:Uncharacterized protein n=1 Tax=Anguilla anguilla TaxID=7936 RepID=A0A0E9P6G8_ANGAN